MVETTTHDDSEEDSSRPPSYTIYVITILLAVNVSSLVIGRARQSLGFEFLPYTLLVFSCGLGLGFVTKLLNAHEADNGGDDADAFSSEHWKDQTTSVLSLFRALAAARTVDPDLVMLVLLPPLIYTAASHANWHTFKKSFGAILTLAFPAVGFSTVAIAYFFKMLPHTGSWSFSQALTLGSILAATDPVAVVAALHELGAPPKLDMLIDGESLVNDGSAMVFFLIFNDLGFEGQDIEVGEGVFRFVRLAVGGPLFGAAMFVLLWFWLDYHVTSAGEAMVSVMTTYYATFFVAEKILHVSGVLAVVVLGLGMARKGKWAVPPAAAKGLELLNENFSSLAESSIFFLAGVVTFKAMHLLFKSIDKNSADDDGGDDDDHSGGDGHGDEDDADETYSSSGKWAPGGANASKSEGAVLSATPGELVLNLFLVYFIVHLVRFAALCFASPVLQRTGYFFTWRELAVSWFGGLRGAVGLALAMEVVNEGRHHKTSHSTDTGDAGGGGGGDALITTTLVREELLFYVAGIVVLTLVINGTLIGHFYHFLNPYPESAHETELRRLGILTTAESVEHTCSRPEWVVSHGEELGWGLQKSDYPTVLKLVPTPVDVKMKASGEFTLLDEGGKPLGIDVLSVVLHDVIADKARQSKPLVKKAAHAIMAANRLNKGMHLAAAAAHVNNQKKRASSLRTSLSRIQSRGSKDEDDDEDDGEDHGNSGGDGEQKHEENEEEQGGGSLSSPSTVAAAAAVAVAGVAEFDTEIMLAAAWGKVLALAKVRPEKVKAIFTRDRKKLGIGPGGKPGELGVALGDVGHGLAKLGVALSQEELQLWFTGCDSNGDGMMCLNEFEAAVEARRKHAVLGETAAAADKQNTMVSQWESIVASIGIEEDDEVSAAARGGSGGHEGGGGGQGKTAAASAGVVGVEGRSRGTSAARSLFPATNNSVKESSPNSSPPAIPTRVGGGGGGGHSPKGGGGGGGFSPFGHHQRSKGSSSQSLRLSPKGGTSFSMRPWAGGSSSSPAGDSSSRSDFGLGVSAGEQHAAMEQLRESALKASVSESMSPSSSSEALNKQQVSWGDDDDDDGNSGGVGEGGGRHEGDQEDHDQDDEGGGELRVRAFGKHSHRGSSSSSSGGGGGGGIGGSERRRKFLRVGSTVKIVKPKSTKYGMSATVLDPDWHGRVKVQLQGFDRSDKSYLRRDLMVLADWQNLHQHSSSSRGGGGSGSHLTGGDHHHDHDHDDNDDDSVSSVGSSDGVRGRGIHAHSSFAKGSGMNEDDLDAAFDIQQRYRKTLASIRLHSISPGGCGSPGGGCGSPGAAAAAAAAAGGGRGGAGGGRGLPGARSSRGILTQLTDKHSYVLIHDRGSVGRIFGMINELYEELYQHKQLVEIAMCSLVDATTAGEEYIEGELTRLHAIHQSFKTQGSAQITNAPEGPLSRLTSSVRESSWGGGEGGGLFSKVASWFVKEDKPAQYSIHDVMQNAQKERQQQKGETLGGSGVGGGGGASGEDPENPLDSGSAAAASSTTSGGGGTGETGRARAATATVFSVDQANDTASHQAARELTIGAALEEELKVLLAGLPRPRTDLKRRLYGAVPFLRPLIRFLAFRDIYYSVMILTAFIKAHRDLPRILAGKGLLRARALQRVQTSCAAVNARAFEHLRMLAIDFPVAVHVARVVLFALDLNHAKNLEVMKLHEQGFLDHHQAATFVEPFHRTMHALHFCADSFSMHRLVLDYDAIILESQKHRELVAKEIAQRKATQAAEAGAVAAGPAPLLTCATDGGDGGGDGEQSSTGSPLFSPSSSSSSPPPPPPLQLPAVSRPSHAAAAASAAATAWGVQDTSSPPTSIATGTNPSSSSCGGGAGGRGPNLNDKVELVGLNGAKEFLNGRSAVVLACLEDANTYKVRVLDGPLKPEQGGRREVLHVLGSNLMPLNDGEEGGGERRSRLAGRAATLSRPSADSVLANNSSDPTAAAVALMESIALTNTDGGGGGGGYNVGDGYHEEEEDWITGGLMGVNNKPVGGSSNSNGGGSSRQDESDFFVRPSPVGSVGKGGGRGSADHEGGRAEGVGGRGRGGRGEGGVGRGRGRGRVGDGGGRGGGRAGGGKGGGRGLGRGIPAARGGALEGQEGRGVYSQSVDRPAEVEMMGGGGGRRVASASMGRPQNDTTGVGV